MPLFTDPTPKPLDSEWALLAKIAQLLQEGCAGGGGGAGVSSLSVNGGPPQTGAVSITTGGGPGVTSVQGDPGPAVVLDSADIPEGASNFYYTAARFNTSFAGKTTTDLAEGTGLYFTNARAIAATLTGFVAGAGTVTAADSILTALQKVVGNATASTLLNFDDTNANADASILINSGATEIIKVVGATTFVQLNTSRIHRNVSSSTLSILSGTGTTDGAFTEYRGDTASSPGAITHVTKGTADYSIKVAPIASGVAASLWVISSIGNVTQTPTWNDAGTTFVALDVNATNTASGGGSLLGRFRASSVTQWSVSKAGQTTQLGTLLGPVGSAALPTFSFSATPDLGMYRVDANTIGFSAGGVEVVTMNRATSGISVTVAEIEGLTINQDLNGAADASSIRLLPGWDTTGSPSLIFADVGNFASGAASKFIDFQLNSSPRFSVSKDGNVIGLGTLSAAAALFTVSATGVLQLANGTALGADPTAATSQWAVGGEWQYRSSAASEGAGQTNRVHNRGATVQGVGTDYTLTTSMARVDFGTTDPEIVLPTAGTYKVFANCQFQADISSTTDLHAAQLRNSTDSVFIGSEKRATVVTAFWMAVSFSVVISVTASKTVQLWAVNYVSARGQVMAPYTNISYVRLY